MKKKIIICFLALISILFFNNVVYGKTGVEIMRDFLNRTSISKHSTGTMKLEMSMTSQGTTVPIVVSFSSDRKNVRIEMTIQGKVMTIVINDDKGWIEAAGKVQVLPQEFIVQTKYISFFSTFKQMMDKCVFDVISGEEDSMYVLRAKEGDSPIGIVVINKDTGLVDQMYDEADPVKSKLNFSDYKTFSDVFMPSKIVTESGVFNISAVDFDIKLPDDCFSRPTL